MSMFKFQLTSSWAELMMYMPNLPATEGMRPGVLAWHAAKTSKETSSMFTEALRVTIDAHSLVSFGIHKASLVGVSVPVTITRWGNSGTLCCTTNNSTC